MITPRRSDSSPLTVSKGEGRLKVSAHLFKIGEDYLVLIHGGEKSHIGGLALSVKGSPPIAFSLPQHKDYLVAVKAASMLSRDLGATCLVVAGIHVENASKEEIEILVKRSEECIRLLIDFIRRSGSRSSVE